MRFRELQDKEVINACDCCKLGYVVDLVIDECRGVLRRLLFRKVENFVDYSEMGLSILFLLNVSKESVRILF